jgi:hypothetical protein
MFHEVAHQAIMRTSLRRRDCLNPVTAIVSDKTTAEAIARQFPGCNIGPINGCIKKVIGLSNTEKQSKSRLAKLIETHDLNSLVIQHQCETLGLTNVTAVNDSSFRSSWEKMSPTPISIGIDVQNIPKQPEF